VGISKREISSSVNPYLNSIGKKGIFTLGIKISEVEHITINLIRHGLNIDFISANVREGIELKLDFELFQFIVPLVKEEPSYTNFLTAKFRDEHRIGNLYSFDEPKKTSWLLSEYVMQGIQQYNWDQYTEWMARSIKEGERKRAELEEQFRRDREKEIEKAKKKYLHLVLEIQSKFLSDFFSVWSVFI
jgi:hypothetical protein